MSAPTKRQREVLDVINRHFETHGYRPSYQLIATDLKLRSRAGIARIVRDLEGQGLLERRRENGHFSIETKAGERNVSIDWLDTQPGGLAPGDLESKPLSIPAFMIGTYAPAELRAFLVTDSLMEPEFALDDIVLIELRDFCRNDTTIVAKVDDGGYILRNYQRRESEIELRGGEGIEPNILSVKSVKIVGICRGLIRPAV